MKQITTEVFWCSVQKANELFPFVLPQLRRERIQQAQNPKVRDERQAVWRLACFALSKAFGKLKEESFVFDDFKIKYNDVFVCLSHSNGAVAVAVSSNDVGVDIQIVPQKASARVANRALNDEEKQAFALSRDKELFLTERWAAKESAFKKSGKSIFCPSKTDTAGVVTKTVTIQNKKYCLALCAEDAAAAIFNALH